MASIGNFSRKTTSRRFLSVCFLLNCVAFTCARPTSARRILESNGQYASEIQKSVEKFGPYPAEVPKGSVAFDDGAHTNLSELVINFSDQSIRGLLVKYSDKKGTSTSVSKLIRHGSSKGSRKAEFKNSPGNPNNILFTQIGGFYDEAGLNALLLVDSSANQYVWGKDASNVLISPKFYTPRDSGYVVGFFGAANHTSLTQIGVYLTKSI